MSDPPPGYRRHRHNPYQFEREPPEPPKLTEFPTGRPEEGTLPYFCDHCGKTYWFKPGDSFLDPSVDPECEAYAYYHGEENPGSSWWKCFWEEGIEKGKQVTIESLT